MAKRYTPDDISAHGAKEFGLNWMMANDTAGNLASKVGLPLNKQTRGPIQCGIYAALGWMRHVQQKSQGRGGTPHIAWAKGVPPVTGYYWLDMAFTCPGETARTIELAQVYISPHSGAAVVAVADYHRGELSMSFMEGKQWAGPLPVPVVEEWMGKDTSVVIPKEEMDRQTREYNATKK
jgi:hypothetical protein